MQLAEMDFNLAVDNQTGKKHVVLGSNTKVYSGAIGAESENTNFLSTYLAIRNKITNKVSPYFAHQYCIMHTNPNFLRFV